MRNIVKGIGLIALVLGISSCDAFNVDVETDFAGVLDVDVAESVAKSTSEGVPFDKEKELDPENDDVKEYREQIQKIGVENVTATVLSVTKDGGEISLTLLPPTSFYIKNDNSTVFWEFTSEIVIEEGVVLTLDDIGGSYEEVEKILEPILPFTIGIEGTSAEGGVSFSIELNIGATITGSII